MPIMIPLCMVLVGLLVTGCAAKQMAYVKDPHQWQERSATDAMVCDRQVQGPTGKAAAPEKWSREMQEDFLRCMSSKGWLHWREQGIPTSY
jgi:hypothetical protein